MTVDEFFRREPDVATLFVMDGVLVRVTVGREARWGGEEIFEGTDVNCRMKYRDREESGRWRGGGGDGGDGCFDDGRGDVLKRNVLDRDVVSDIAGKLEV